MVVNSLLRQFVITIITPKCLSTEFSTKTRLHQESITATHTRQQEMTHGTATIEHVEPGTNTAAKHTRKFTSPPTRLIHWKLSRNRTRCTLHIQQKYRILRDTSAIAPIVRNDRNNYTSFYETRTSVIHIIPFHNNTMMSYWHEIHRRVTSTGLHLLRGILVV